MAGPLLGTKLRVPRQRRGQVARPRLSERLSRAGESKLTLVSAPAGFGKTTVLTEWLAAAPADARSVAWLALDQRDNDPALFWRYLVAALETAAPGAGAGALSLLESASPMEACAMSSPPTPRQGTPLPIGQVCPMGKPRATLVECRSRSGRSRTAARTARSRRLRSSWRWSTASTGS